MEMDWMSLVSLALTALAPAIGSLLFTLWQRASEWLQTQATWIKVGLYAVVSTVVAVLGGLGITTLQGDPTLWNPDSLGSTVLALFYAFIYRRGAVGSTTTANASERTP